MFLFRYVNLKLIYMPNKKLLAAPKKYMPKVELKKYKKILTNKKNCSIIKFIK